jgi:hypothetical protein
LLLPVFCWVAQICGEADRMANQALSKFCRVGAVEARAGVIAERRSVHARVKPLACLVVAMSLIERFDVDGDKITD